MKNIQYSHFFICIAALIVCGIFIIHSIAQAHVEARSDFKPGEVLIKLKDVDDIIKIMVDPEVDMQNILHDFSMRKDVEWIEPNYMVRISSFPSDPDYTKQQYLFQVHAVDAWSQELVVRESRSYARESVIAVMDTGVDISHPDLQENVWVNGGEVPGDGVDNDKNGYIDDVHGWDFLNDTNDPKPKFEPGYIRAARNHGTIVSGIAAARGNNGIGIAGASWRTMIMALRVLDSKGEGDVYDVYRAVNYAIKNKANIINMSFVGVDESPLLRDVIRKAYDAGILIVAAAGNTDPDQTGNDLQSSKMYPVCLDNPSDVNFIIGVASLDKADKRSGFSNYGDNCIDIAAPGEGFFGAEVYNSSVAGFDSYYGGYWSGTSLSTPLVSGTLAMIRFIRPDLNNVQITQALKTGADKLADSGLGAGKLNMHNALKSASEFIAGEPEAKHTIVHFIAAGLGYQSFPQVKIFKGDHGIFKSFFAYSPTFNGSINIATGDVDGDSVYDIVTGAGVRGGPHVRVMDIDGHIKKQFFAFDKNLRSGVNIALGDVDGDGKKEIIAGSGKGSKPMVSVFSYDGKLLGNFLAYAGNFLGGVNVASGDTNGDGKDEIVTGAGAGGGPHVRIFNVKGELLGQFFAYNRESKTGVRVAVGDLNGDIFEEIAVGPENQGSPIVRIFRPTNFEIMSEFYALSPESTFGVNLAVGDTDGDGINEIVAGSGVGSVAEVRVLDWKGNQKEKFLAHPDFYKGGVRVSVMEYSL